VSEDLLGCRLYGQFRPWCVLEKREDGQWGISLAKNQKDGDHRYNPNGYAQFNRTHLVEHRKAWARYEALVTKRYAQVLKWQGREPVSVQPPTMLENNQPLPPDLAVERLAAFFSVDEPAKITPLKRPKEAQRDHHLDPAYNL
jgi:hypothetical protein